MQTGRILLLVLAGVMTCASAGTAGAQDVTYARHVAPILVENCVSCHRPGEIAPIPFV